MSTQIGIDLELMWNLFKNRIDNGAKHSIPLTSRFQNTKWKRPINDT